MLKPGDAVLFINLYDSVTIRYLWALISLTVLAESISFVFVGGILVYLRKHATSFSKVTYKLHMQFTILLAVQVSFGKNECARWMWKFTLTRFNIQGVHFISVGGGKMFVPENQGACTFECFLLGRVKFYAVFKCLKWAQI